MKKNENLGCIQYIKKTNQIVLQYYMHDDSSGDKTVEVGNIILADLKQTKIKNDYDLMVCIYNTVKKNLNKIEPSLKKFNSCTKLLSEGKQIKFKIDREVKKTFITMPDFENKEEEWVRIYPVTSAFNAITKAVLEYNKCMKEKDSVPTNK